MDGDKSGESGAFLFSRRVPDFCDGRRSFPTNETQICTVGDVSDGFRSLPIPYVARHRSPIIHKHRVSGTDLWRLSDIRAKSGIFPTYENQALALPLARGHVLLTEWFVKD